MIRTLNIRSFSAGVAAIGLAAVLAGNVIPDSAAAQATQAQDDRAAEARAVAPGNARAFAYRVDASQDTSDHIVTSSQSIEVTIDDGKIKAKVNGKEVPPDRIRKQDGQIIILDEDGKPLRGIATWLQEGDFKLTFPSHRWSVDLWNTDGAWPSPTLPGEMPQTPRVMLGVQMDTPGAALQKHLRLEDGGVMLTGIYKGLPADEAGLGLYDVIIAVDGAKPVDMDTMHDHLRQREAGDTVELRVIQAGEPKTIKVRLREFDAQTLATAALIGPDQNAAYTYTLSPRSAWFSREQLDSFATLRALPFTERFVVAPGSDREQFFEFVVPQTLHGTDDVRVTPFNHTTPPAADSRDADDRLKALDERLQRLEQMLDRLLREVDDHRE